MKIVRVGFSMEFDDKFSDADIKEWLRFQIGDNGSCSSSEVDNEYGDLNPFMVEIE